MSSGERHVAPLEGTVAVAEVKSRLTKETLREALDGGASIPPMPEAEGIVPPYLRVAKASWNETPYKIVFAYDGLSSDTICAHIAEYYEQNNHIPFFRRPNVIHVLNKYLIIRVTNRVKIANVRGSLEAEQPEQGTFYPLYVAPDVSAMAWILTEVQNYIFSCAHLLFKFDEWHDNIIGAINRGSP